MHIHYVFRPRSGFVLLCLYILCCLTVTVPVYARPKYRSIDERLEPQCGNSLSQVQQRAEAGDARAQANLGYCYSVRGEDSDSCQAARWFRQAAERGNADGQFGLGFEYFNAKIIGLMGDTPLLECEYLPRDDDEAWMWFQRAAEQGHVESQFRLGLGGDVKWLRKAAEQGLPEAQEKLREIEK